MAYSRVEVRVGIFVFLGLTALCAMIIMFGFRHVRLLHDTYPLTAVFQFTNGVVVGAPVRFAGVDVGKVNAIEFATDQTNDVHLQVVIRKGIIIRKDVRLIINSLGIMGEKYLEFIPKSTTAEPYVAWDKVRGEEPLPLNDVVAEALKLVSEFRAAFSDIFDEKTKENVRETIQNLRNLTDEETEKALTNSLKNIARLTGPGTRKKLARALSGFDETTSSIRSLIADHREDIHAILTRWKGVSEALESVALNLKESKGTLGLLISTPTLHESLNKTLTNLNEWVTMIRKHGLLYKEKEVEKTRESRTRPQNNRGYFFRRR